MNKWGRIASSIEVDKFNDSGEDVVAPSNIAKGIGPETKPRTNTQVHNPPQVIHVRPPKIRIQYNVEKRVWH